MQTLSEKSMVQRDAGYQQTWKEFYRINCDALFQTALLLSADPEVAEAALMTGIDSINPLKPPGKDEFLALQTTIVRHCICSASGAKTSATSTKAGSMLQAGLRPILQLEGSPRICYVLRMLLGCAISSCAQMLGMDEGEVKRLVRVAIVQLHRAVAVEKTEFGLSQENAESCQSSPKVRQDSVNSHSGCGV